MGVRKNPYQNKSSWAVRTMEDTVIDPVIKQHHCTIGCDRKLKR